MFDLHDVDEASERITRTGRALPVDDSSSLLARDSSSAADWRRQLTQQARRIAELEAREAAMRVTQETLRSEIIDAVGALVDAKPRSRAALLALERIVELLG